MFFWDTVYLLVINWATYLKQWRHLSVVCHLSVVWPFISIRN